MALEYSKDCMLDKSWLGADLSAHFFKNCFKITEINKFLAT